MKRPCSQHWRKHGFEPYNAPTDPSKGGLTMACADLCDEDVARCYCNSSFPHGRVPADPSAPPGTPPQRHGRLLPHNCRRNTGWDGQKSEFGTVDYDKLYGAAGWCQADEPGFKCGCTEDGWDGPTCEDPHEAFCINQCSGHGECQHGFCKCHAGWFGHDCAYRTADTPWTPGMEDKERPWLKLHVNTPAARDPEPDATRRRPLIYIYELPAVYNTNLLQYRTEKWQCVHRHFDKNNESRSNDGNLHQPEPGIHEMLAQSSHRTLDPEEADYFYLPIYVRCLTSFIYAADFPFFHGGPFAPRTHAATNMFIEAHHWLSTHLPYWNRNGGRDHILTAVHDEGSCWVPSVLRPAIHLVHWGRTDVPHTSESGYVPDNYSINSTHPVWQPEGHLGKLQPDKFPCYDPSKDLVIPMMHTPNKYKSSPFFGGRELNRTMLAFFKGRIQPDNPKYSRGTRQFLANISQAEDWWGKHKIWIGDGVPPTHQGSYSDFLAQSIFCLALMGDGWTARFEDGLMNGCIPVIIIDNVELTWHSIMDLDAYSLRVPQADMARLPEILKAVPPENVARMQANIRKVWRRHLWTSYRPYGDVARALVRSRHKESAAQAAPDIDFNQDDAFSTIIQWLYAKMDELGAHAPARASRRDSK